MSCLHEALLMGAGRLAESDASCEAVLERTFMSVRVDLPELALEEFAFMRFCGAHLSPQAPVYEALTQLRWRDLAIVYGCLQGQTAALELFDREYIHPLVHSGFSDEVLQRTRERLLTAHPSSKLTTYRGHAPLSVWVRVVASRVAHTQRAKERESPLLEDDEVLMAEAAAADVELELIRARYRQEFRMAMRAALGTLTPQERNILRFALVDALPLERIAVVYQVHRTTLRRWLDQACARVSTEARAVLRRQLRLSEPELESALRGLRADSLLSLTDVLMSD